MRIMVAVAVAFLGCGGGDEASPLVGLWTVTAPDGCLDALTLQASGSYEADAICNLTDGSVGMESEVGEYWAGGDQITFSVNLATCADATKTRSYGFSLPNHSQLNLVGQTGIVAFARTRPVGGSGVARLGCWEADGLFHVMPLTAIP